jgi:hypothetical protein
MTYASSAELVSYLRLPAGTEDGTLLDLALAGADSAIDGYLDQSLVADSSETFYLNGDGSDVLRAPRFPLTAVTTLTVYPDGARESSSADVLVDGTGYRADLDKGLIYRIDGGVFTEGRQNISLVCAFGYDTIPAVVRVVACQVAARIYEVGMAENESAAGMSTTWVKGAGSLTVDERRALHRYRRSS